MGERTASWFWAVAGGSDRLTGRLACCASSTAMAMAPSSMAPPDPSPTGMA